MPPQMDATEPHRTYEHALMAAATPDMLCQTLDAMLDIISGCHGPATGLHAANLWQLVLPAASTALPTVSPLPVCLLMQMEHSINRPHRGR